jgi:hypothetical protein
MQHHFSTWSERLAPEARGRFDARLRFLEQILTAADDGTPHGLKQTALCNETSPAASLETVLAALECATACRHSHPDDFGALCAIMKVAIKGQLPVSAD